MATTTNRITKVAIVGAGGHSGRPMAEELIKTGQHTVTALTRLDSTSELAKGVIVKRVDYSKPETVVEALKGQQALVITLGAPLQTEQVNEVLYQAAAEAGVAWILPNEWGQDSTHPGILKDIFVFPPKAANREKIAKIGKSSFIGVVPGAWYEWSLSIPPAFGFDFEARTVHLYDEGENKICSTTWPQLGRAVAKLLSLPINPEGNDKDACLAAMRDQVVFVNSFQVTQKEILASVLRVTGTKESDWTITKAPAREQYAQGLAEFQSGKHMGMVKVLYGRVHFDDGASDFETHKSTINELIGLEKETDLDAATRAAIKRSQDEPWGRVFENR